MLSNFQQQIRLTLDLTINLPNPQEKLENLIKAARNPLSSKQIPSSIHPKLTKNNPRVHRDQHSRFLPPNK